MVLNTKKELLDVAEEAARSRGFDGFSFADLADGVGIRKASVHHHFPSKAALSDALIVRYHDRIIGRCAQIDTVYPRAADRLKAFVKVYRDALGVGDRLCLCVSFSAGQNSLPSSVCQRMIEFRTDMIAWLQSVFQLALDDKSIVGVETPGLEAAATLAMLEGAQLSARTAQNLLPFDSATELLRLRLR